VVDVPRLGPGPLPPSARTPTPSRRHLAARRLAIRSDTLHFAARRPGTSPLPDVHGAYMSGRRAAHEILALSGRHQRSAPPSPRPLDIQRRSTDLLLAQRFARQSAAETSVTRIRATKNYTSRSSLCC